MTLAFEWDPRKAASNFAKHGVSFEEAATAFGDALSLSIPDASHSQVETRLVPLGQTDSQRVLARLEADVVSIARRALAASLDDLGSATFRADLASLRHEAQYTRLFRS